ncbi:MAG: AmpG family muropeptide MFS transporter [Salinisphaera sp.]|uniref:AmpG family muropeptide MFS transporter n=1 Tax=Salinisphaera sp. TaxID=1914330 RepID=UPI003C7D8743
MTLNSEYRVAGRSGGSPRNNAAGQRDWRRALAIYTQPRVVGMGFLGFSSGLPFLLVFSTLSAWLTTAGVSKTTIGFFSWIGLTYSIKFFWAPVIDRLPLPVLSRLLGRRRGWMLLAQTGLMAGLFGMAGTDPSANLEQIAWFGLLVAFSSATQDVTIDAWRIEAVAEDLQGAMAATYQAGYRIAMLVAGAGAFYIAAGASWSAAYYVMAALVGVGMVTVLVLGEPDASITRDTEIREQWAVDWLDARAHQPAWLRGIERWVIGAVACPFWDFFARYGRQAILILLVVSLYRLAEITLGVMANPFYLDSGYTPEQIASISKIFGLLMTISGAGIGGVLVVRFGILKPLLAGAILSALANLVFAWLATIHDPGLGALTVTISAENLSGGLAGSAFIAYLSSLTNTAYTATQYALFSSLMTLPGKFVGGFSGWVVDHAGYTWFFIDTSIAALPVIALLAWLLARSDSERVPATS